MQSVATVTLRKSLKRLLVNRSYSPQDRPTHPSFLHHQRDQLLLRHQWELLEHPRDH